MSQLITVATVLCMASHTLAGGAPVPEPDLKVANVHIAFDGQLSITVENVGESTAASGGRLVLFVDGKLEFDSTLAGALTPTSTTTVDTGVYVTDTMRRLYTMVDYDNDVAEENEYQNSMSMRFQAEWVVGPDLAIDPMIDGAGMLSFHISNSGTSASTPINSPGQLFSYKINDGSPSLVSFDIPALNAGEVEIIDTGIVVSPGDEIEVSMQMDTATNPNDTDSTNNSTLVRHVLEDDISPFVSGNDYFDLVNIQVVRDAINYQPPCGATGCDPCPENEADYVPCATVNIDSWFGDPTWGYLADELTAAIAKLEQGRKLDFFHTIPPQNELGRISAEDGRKSYMNSLAHTLWFEVNKQALHGVTEPEWDLANSVTILGPEATDTALLLSNVVFNQPAADGMFFPSRAYNPQIQYGFLTAARFIEPTMAETVWRLADWFRTNSLHDGPGFNTSEEYYATTETNYYPLTSPAVGAYINGGCGNVQGAVKGALTPLGIAVNADGANLVTHSDIDFPILDRVIPHADGINAGAANTAGDFEISAELLFLPRDEALCLMAAAGGFPGACPGECQPGNNDCTYDASCEGVTCADHSSFNNSRHHLGVLLANRQMFYMYRYYLCACMADETCDYPFVPAECSSGAPDAHEAWARDNLQFGHFSESEIQAFMDNLAAVQTEWSMTTGQIAARLYRQKINAIGLSTLTFDCNNNGIADSLELAVDLEVESPTFTPFGDVFPAVWNAPTYAVPEDEVRVLIRVNADLALADGYFDFYMDSQFIERLGEVGGSQCADRIYEVFIPQEDYYQAMIGGTVEFSAVASAGVDTGVCAGTISFEVEFPHTNDCNKNSLPDVCDDPLVDCDGNSIPDDCETAAFLVFDCNENGSLDICEVTEGTADDCNANSLPDTCDSYHETRPATIFASDLNDTCLFSACEGPVKVAWNINAYEPLVSAVVWLSVGQSCFPENTALATTLNGQPGTPMLTPSTHCTCEDRGEPVFVPIPLNVADYNLHGPNELEIFITDCIGFPIEDGMPGTARSLHAGIELKFGFSDDCNDNEVPDECEIHIDTPGGDYYCTVDCDADCNGNAIPDACDVEAGLDTDCNNNLVPDLCEPDCNSNGIVDECDITSGVSADCNTNGVPDSCDLDSGHSEDCNSDGVPNECEPDCNNNLSPDPCDLLTGTSDDCQVNGVPDECDVLGFDTESSQYSPFYCIDHTLTHTFTNLPPAPDTVTFILDSVSDWGPIGPLDLDVLLNGVPIGTAFQVLAFCDDGPVSDSISIDAQTFNSLVDGTAEVQLMHSRQDCVDPDPDCVSDSYIQVRIQSGSPDCDGNSNPDECDACVDQPWCSDCNENGIMDSCDISSGISVDTHPANGVPDECECAAGISGLNAAECPNCFSCIGDSTGFNCTDCSDTMPCVGEGSCYDGKCYVPSNLYLSFAAPGPTTFTAIRVTDPNTGESAWVSEPNPAGISVLTDTQECYDLTGDDIHVRGCLIEPGGNSYDVQTISCGCDIALEENYSDALQLSTITVWGDVDNNGFANFADILEVVRGFQHASDLPDERVEMDGNGVVNIADVSRTVCAFQGFTYQQCLPPNSPCLD